MVREAAVGLEVARDDVELRKALENRGKHRSGHPVCRIDHDSQRSHRLDVDEREDLVDEGRPDVHLQDLSAPIDPSELSECALPHLVQPGVAADRQSAAAHDLHPGVVLRVVGGGDADASVELELADGEVEHLGADEPEIVDLGSRVGCPVHHGRRHPG